ncbi:MAG: PAAR domain-containing protein [Pelistega sp.]|nr:PAAR domain-containing protein [Pelistega sp.]
MKTDLSAATPVATIGTKTTHGGIVVTASSHSTILGKPIACVGDKVTCPKHGTNYIVDGSFATINGKQIARHGSKTSCGASLIVAESHPVV